MIGTSVHVYYLDTEENFVSADKATYLTIGVAVPGMVGKTEWYIFERESGFWGEASTYRAINVLANASVVDAVRIAIMHKNIIFKAALYQPFADMANTIAQTPGAPFAAGFFEGFADGFKNSVGGLWSMVKFMATAYLEYSPEALATRAARGDTFASEFHAVAKAAQVIATIATAATHLYEYGAVAAFNLAVNPELALPDVPKDVQDIVSGAADIFMRVIHAAKQLSQYDVGKLEGQVAYVIVEAVLTAGAATALTEASLATRVGSAVAKLAPEAAPAFEALADAVPIVEDAGKLTAVEKAQQVLAVEDAAIAEKVTSGAATKTQAQQELAKVVDQYNAAVKTVAGGGEAEIATSPKLFDELQGLDLDELKLPANRRKAGDIGEEVVKKLTGQSEDFEEVIAVKNPSNHGLDVVARGKDGKYYVFEVKTTAIGKTGALQGDQKFGALEYAKKILQRAAKGKAGYSDAPADRAAARALFDAMNDGNVVGIKADMDLTTNTLRISKWIGKVTG